MRVPFQDVLVILLAYLIGSIPCSYLAARLRGVDIRERGEGNVGARNVFHVVGARWGVAAAVLDLAKGAAAYLVGRQLATSTAALLACGVAAPLGHCYSPFLRFRGGKGVATTVGLLMVFQPWSTLVGWLVFFAAYLATRDANKALPIGIVPVIVLPPLFGSPLWTIPYVLCLFLLLGVKKIIDRQHEQAVWARDPWQSGQPGFHPELLEDGGTASSKEVTSL